MNQLTERLLTAGYTKEKHPGYVEWSNWNHFEFTREYLAASVWETPCGLLKKGMEYNNGSHMGVTYCPENDNPRCGCPYYDEKPCQHRFNTNLWGWNCAYHQTDRPYDYEQSVENLWDEWDRIKHQAWMEATQGVYCACMEWDRVKRKYLPTRYYTQNCISANCQNEICLITKKTRNLEKVNIFYDVLREWHYKKGLIMFNDRKIEKGVRVFKKPVARTDAELWLKRNKDEIFRPKNDDRRDMHFSEHHGKTGFGEYGFFEFTATAQNIRIERREPRDLLQDLADAAEGLEVTHASDLEKRKKEAYRERKAKRKIAKDKKSERQIIENLRRIALEGNYIEGKPASEQMKKWAKEQLQKRGIGIKESVKGDQQTLGF